MKPKIDIDRIYNVMDREGVDVLLTLYPPNVFYISDIPCNYTTQNRLLYAIKTDSPIFCLFPRDYKPKLILSNSAYETAKKHTWIDDIITYRTGVYIVRTKSSKIKNGKMAIENEKSALEALIDALKSIRPKSLAIEKEHLSVSVYEELRSALPDMTLRNSTPIFKELRMTQKA